MSRVLASSLPFAAFFCLAGCVADDPGTGRTDFALSLPTLGAATSFAVLAGTTVTETSAAVTPTSVTGDVGVSPGTAITGFPAGTITGGSLHLNDGPAVAAQAALTVAYNNAAGQACDTVLTGSDLGGMTLPSGVYCFASSAQLTGTLFLDGAGDANSIWVFQIGSTLTTATDSAVIMIGGGLAGRAFWQVGSSATLGTGTHFSGNILALTSITLTTGVSIDGRALARNGAVTLDTVTINTASTGSSVGVDDDLDGVPDAEDSCTGSASGAITDDSGCSIPQLCPCAHKANGGKWKDHDAYVSCVTKAAKDFKNAGLITTAQKGAIVWAAAHSTCGKKSHGHGNGHGHGGHDQDDDGDHGDDNNCGDD